MQRRPHFFFKLMGCEFTRPDATNMENNVNLHTIFYAKTEVIRKRNYICIIDILVSSVYQS